MVLREKAGTLRGGTLAMTLGESVECLCTTDFTCLTTEMQYGGTCIEVSFLLNLLSLLSDIM